MAKIKNMGTATMKFGEGIIVSGSSPQIYASGSVEAEDLVLDKSVEPAISFSVDGDARAKISVNTSNNLVLHNQFINKHIVLKVNDQGVTREGLRIDGAVPEVVVNEGSESLVDFRVESDNQTHMLFVDGANDRVGIKTSQPDYTLHVAGDMGVNQYIYHNGDNNTFINFTDNQIRFNAGGINFLSLEDDGSAPYPATVNNGGNRINFRVLDRNSNLLLKTNSEDFWAGLYYGGSQKLVTSNTGVSVTGALTASLGLSGSLTRLTDGSSYLVAGANVTITSASNGQVTIAAAGGGGGSGTPAGADTQIQFNDGGSSFGASSNLTWDDTELKISGTSTSALLNLQTTEDSSTASPVLELTRVSSSPADSDYLGQIKFVGKHDGNGVTTYAKITGKIDDASANTEDGIIEFSNVKAGSQTITARLRSDSLQLLNGTNCTVDGSLGVGTTQPQTTVHIHSDSINNGTVTISQSDNSGDASQLDLTKSRGSGASPAAVQNTDFVGQIRMVAYDGDSYDNFADIYAQAAGTISTTSHPTKVVIRTTPLNQTSPVEAVTIDDNQNMTVAGSVYGKMRHMTHHRYNDGSGTGKEYIPWAGTSEQPSPSYITMGVAPYNGRLAKVLVRSSKSGGLGSTVVGMHIGTDGTTTFNSTAEETVTVNMASANTTGTFSFTSANHFAAGDTIAVSIDPTSAHGNVNVTCVWEYDITA